MPRIGKDELKQMVKPVIRNFKTSTQRFNHIVKEDAVFEPQLSANSFIVMEPGWYPNHVTSSITFSAVY